MNILQKIAARAARQPAHIVLCEGEDARVLHAVTQAVHDGIARITLVGNGPRIKACAAQEGVSLDALDIIDPATSPLTSTLSDALKQVRPRAHLSDARARDDALDPLNFANLLVRTGHAQGSVAGAVYTSPAVIRSANRIIGRAADQPLLSSIFLMQFDRPHHPVHGGMIFADCAVNIEPSAVQLADIAINAAWNAQFLLEEAPRIAMLSFSTAGSARHARTEKVIRAARLVREKCPDIIIDEEVQLDAAVVPDVTARKMPGSRVQGRANVLVFPDLDAGNIGYKMAERFGGATAIGPLLQGLAKPANDLSRGCSSRDIYYAIAVTSVQSQAHAHALSRNGHTNHYKT